MCGATHVSIGNSVGSQSQSTTVYTSMLPDDCPARIDKSNWLGGHGYGDFFDVTVGECPSDDHATGHYTTGGEWHDMAWWNTHETESHTNWDTQWQGDHLGDWHVGGDVFTPTSMDVTNGGGTTTTCTPPPMDLTNGHYDDTAPGTPRTGGTRTATLPRALGLDLQRRAPPAMTPCDCQDPHGFTTLPGRHHPLQRARSHLRRRQSVHRRQPWRLLRRPLRRRYGGHYAGHYDAGHYDAGHYDAGHYDAGHYDGGHHGRHYGATTRLPRPPLGSFNYCWAAKGAKNTASTGKKDVHAASPTTKSRGKRPQASRVTEVARRKSAAAAMNIR